MAENSHLISKMPERETGLPNTYSRNDASLWCTMGWDETKTDRTFPSLGLTDAGKLDLPNTARR